MSSTQITGDGVAGNMSTFPSTEASQSFYAQSSPPMDSSQAPNSMNSGYSSSMPIDSSEELSEETINELVANLIVAEKRNMALLKLSRDRSCIVDLAPILWHSFGSITAILQEIISIYPYLSPPSLKKADSNRVCNALVLLQTLANHPDTRQKLIDAQIPIFLFPFLNTVCKTIPFEHIRFTSLGVIGVLVKEDEPRVISFLLKTEMLPICIRMIEMGCKLTATVAAYIIMKILLDNQGLNYICQTPERFYAISTVLNRLVIMVKESFQPKMLKFVIRSYLRLCDEPRSREALKKYLPEELKDDTFLELFDEDHSFYHQQLLNCLLENPNGDIAASQTHPSLQNLSGPVNYPTFPPSSLTQYHSDIDRKI